MQLCHNFSSGNLRNFFQRFFFLRALVYIMEAFSIPSICVLSSRRLAGAVYYIGHATFLERIQL